MENSEYLPPTPSRATVWVLGGLIMALLAWSVIGKLDVVVSARGRLVNEGLAKTVQAPVAGSVLKIHVQEGRTVKAGEVLLELDNAVYAAEVASIREKLALASAELVRLEAEHSEATGGGAAAGRENGSAEQEGIRKARQDRFLDMKRELAAALASRQANLSAGRAALEGLKARLAVVQEKEEAARPHVGVAIPRFQYLQWKDDLVSLKREVEVQQQNLVRMASEVNESQQRLLRASSEWRNELAQDVVAKRALQVQLTLELEKARKRVSDAVIRAPVDGVVQKVAVSTIGGNVSPHDALVQLIPTDAPLLLEVLIPNEERGFLKAGQPVDVKLDAYPFQKYGRLSGTLVWASPDAELLTEVSAGLLTSAAEMRVLRTQAPQYVYRGRVSLAPGKSGVIRLSPGLTAQADIVTDERRIIDFFLFPLQKMGEEALAVR